MDIFFLTKERPKGRARFLYISQSICGSLSLSLSDRMNRDNRVQVSDGNRECALFFMALLVISSILVFPHYMQPEPPAILALVSSIVPVSILFYVFYLLLFVW